MTHDPSSRRRFLVASGALGGALALGRFARAQDGQDKPTPAAPVAPPAPPKKLFSISLAQGSLRRALQAQRMDNLDFPVVAKKDYDIHAIELVTTFFPDKSQDLAYLRELKKRADDHGVRCCVLRVDDEGQLADPDDEKQRKASVEKHKKWANAAAFLGCHSLRVQLRGKGSRNDLREAAVRSLTSLGHFADPLELRVLVESRGGYSAESVWLSNVITLTEHKRVGTLPDFGEAKLDAETDRSQNVKELMPWACAIAARSFDFDERGEETSIDYHKLVKVVVDAGYRSWIGIEYEGERLSEPDGIRATKKLLEKVRDELGAAPVK